MDISGGSFDKPCTYIHTYALAAATAETITKPATPPNVYNACRITGDGAWAYRVGANAVYPAADVTDGTGSGLVAAGQSRFFNFMPDGSNTPIASISVISTPGCNLSVEWFR